MAQKSCVLRYAVGTMEGVRYPGSAIPVGGFCECDDPIHRSEADNPLSGWMQASPAAEEVGEEHQSRN